MTSINSSERRECHLSVSTVFAESVYNSGPVVSPIRIRFDESYGFGDEIGDEDEVEKKKSRASAIKTSIFWGFHQFPFHGRTKKTGSAPTSPETLPVRITSNKPSNQNTRATVNARFRLFKSAPKSTKDSRRPPPPPLDLQSPSTSYPIKENQRAFLASPIKLDASTPASEDSDFAKSPEAGVQLLFQTLSEESDQEDIPEVALTEKKEDLFQGYIHHEDTTSAYLASLSPWFTSWGPSPMAETTEKVEAIAFPTYLPALCGDIPQSPPLLRKNQHQPAATVKPIPAFLGSLLVPGSPTVQPPTPRSVGSPKSFLFDEGEESDIEDSPADFYAKKPSPATSRRSSFSVSRGSSTVSRRSSISRSRKSSTATFFCRGQCLSFDRHNSIGLGGLTGDEVEIKDDAGSTFYPGINELKSKSSWLYTNPPEYSSSDDEDDEDDQDDDSEIEEAYQKHLSLITRIRNTSTLSLAASASSPPELTMSSSVSSEFSYHQILATPSRRNRRRTASSECIVLAALEEMRVAGLNNPEDEEGSKSRGVGFLEDMDFGSDWADVVDSGEQPGWDWETQQMTLIDV